MRRVGLRSSSGVPERVRSVPGLCARLRSLSLDRRLVRVGRAAWLVRAMRQLCGPRLTLMPTGAPWASVAPFFGDWPST